MLLRDEALADQVRQAVTNIQGATGELKSAAANAATLVSDLQSKGFPQKVDDTLTEVLQTAKSFNAASAQVRQVVADLTGPDQPRGSPQKRPVRVTSKPASCRPSSRTITSFTS